MVRFINARKRVQALFTDHPRETGETYLQHLWFTLKMSFQFFLCGAVLLAHGLIPFIFTRTASTRVSTISAVMKTRGKNSCE